MKKSIIFLGCLLCIMVSCSHEPIEPEFQGPNVVNWNDSSLNGDAYLSQMHFSVGSNMVVERGAVTRATTDYDGTGTFSTGDLIAVAVTQNSNPEEIKLYRVKSDGSLEYAGSGEPFIWKKSTISVRAWSYGTSTNLSFTLTAPETFDYTLETDQNTNGYRELLYCKAADKTYSTTPMTLAFYHQLSRLVINVDHDKTGALSVTSASIGSATFPIAACFSVPTGSSNVGSWALKTTYGTITPKTETTQASYQQTYSAVIFPETYTKDTKMFTVTNGDGNYVYRITQSAGQSLTAGNQYNYTVTIKDDITKNPLWWVAQYNLASNKTSFVAAHSTTDQYVFTFADAQGANVSYYHVPTRDEQVSIIPSNTSTDGGANIFSWTNTLANPYEFSEIACSVGGTIVPASTSVFGKKGTADFYAVRFINTPYASAWHYKEITSPCVGLLIESYLLSGVTTLDEAKAILTGFASSISPFTGSLGASNANLTPESSSIKARCFVQRFIPATGSRGTAYSNSGVANSGPGTHSSYWSSTSINSNAFHWSYVKSGSENSTGTMYENQTNRLNARSVRLFKGGYLALHDATTADIGKVICSNAHIHNTVSDVTCGGTPSAMIAYIGNQNNAAGTGEYSSTFNHGLAVALTDVKNTSGTEGNASMTWTDARTAAGAYKRARPSSSSTWFLPSAYQWQRILIACGSSASFVSDQSNLSATYTTNNSFRYSQFRTKLTACGGTDVITGSYWLNTEYSTNTSGAWRYWFDYQKFGTNLKTASHGVRPVLAF